MRYPNHFELFKTHITIGAFACGALIAGCAEDAKPPATADGANARITARADVTTVAETSEDTSDETGVSAIYVDEEIARICNLPVAHFAFDSAQLEPGAQRSLDTLLRCLNEDSLKGRGLKVVGHADPRGTEPYNFALGQRRAGQVAEYLIDGGIAEKRIETTSMGELEADGFNRETWAEDRRVEILLTDEMTTVGQNAYRDAR